MPACERPGTDAPPARSKPMKRDEMAETDDVIEYTVILPEADVKALALGTVTPAVQNLAWSCLKSMHLLPEFTLTAEDRRAS